MSDDVSPRSRHRPGDGRGGRRVRRVTPDQSHRDDVGSGPLLRSVSPRRGLGAGRSSRHRARPLHRTGRLTRGSRHALARTRPRGRGDQRGRPTGRHRVYGDVAGGAPATGRAHLRARSGSRKCRGTRARERGRDHQAILRDGHVERPAPRGGRPLRPVPGRRSKPAPARASRWCRARLRPIAFPRSDSRDRVRSDAPGPGVRAGVVAEGAPVLRMASEFRCAGPPARAPTPGGAPWLRGHARPRPERGRNDGAPHAPPRGRAPQGPVSPRAATGIRRVRHRPRTGLPPDGAGVARPRRRRRHLPRPRRRGLW